MIPSKKYYWMMLLFAFAVGCTPAEKEAQTEESVAQEEFQYLAEQFADLKIIRYKIPGFDKLSTSQKTLVYYLTQAGLEGRDIMYDMNYRHNLTIRKALENITKTYDGDKEAESWKQFEVYLKRIWFSNGIHHHYSNAKMMPDFSKEYLQELMAATGTEISAEIVDVMFDATLDAKKVNLNPDLGLVKGSAVNFYDSDITEAEVDAFYAPMLADAGDTPLSYGLNSKLVRAEDGTLKEEVYKVGGLYGAAIERIIFWLEKAATVAENEPQKIAFELLVEYYKTGSLETWDEYNVAWVSATEGDIDYINSFIEVYNDPKGYRGSYETIVEINDFDASERMKVVSDNVQWFEDNSSIMDEHKKAKVVGVTYKVVNVAGESGDASPSTPIGVNLPNANWIRATHGSKSVSLGNIVAAYSKAGGSGFLQEFAFNEEEIALAKEYGDLAHDMHVALHEVVGHASGQLNEGVGTPKETLKNYASTLEEARADLVALYFIYDQKMIDLGLVPNIDVAKETYDSYIRGGMMTQLRRLKIGDDVEEAHMRNRQLIAKWVFEKGAADNVIEQVVKDEKTYFVVRDYEKLYGLFGDLLKEIQRIKSEGDFEAGKALVENYGVKVDQAIHQEVLDRASKLKSAPYGGFINPKLVPVTDDAGNITDVKVEYPADFTKQMLYYAETYSNL